MKNNRCAAWVAALHALLAIPLATGVLDGQTDYYNLDRGRPARIEDAQATELYAVGVKLAPLRIEQEEDGGFSRWVLLPELAYGILPGTSIEVGLPITALSDGATGLSGAELSIFHSLNVETAGLPGLAIRGDLELPVGALGPDRVIPSLAGIVTRTHRIARFHANARYTIGSAEDLEGHSEGRWLAGAAVDRAFPLRAMLLIGEVYAVGPIEEDEDLLWTASVGSRYQLNPYVAIDAGVGRTFARDPRWHLTLGSAVHLGIRSLVRGGQ